jgi:hypothetical protein
MVSGYSSANVGLSWVEEEKFKTFAFMDKDLSKAGMKKLFPWKGEYFKATNCPQCQIVLIDYSQKHDRKAVESEIEAK